MSATDASLPLLPKASRPPWTASSTGATAPSRPRPLRRVATPGRSPPVLPPSAAPDMARQGPTPAELRLPSSAFLAVLPALPSTELPLKRSDRTDGGRPSTSRSSGPSLAPSCVAVAVATPTEAEAPARATAVAKQKQSRCQPAPKKKSRH